MKKYFSLLLVLLSTEMQLNAQAISAEVPDWVKDVTTEAQQAMLNKLSKAFTDVDYGGLADCGGDKELISQVMGYMEDFVVQLQQEELDESLKSSTLCIPYPIHTVAADSQSSAEQAVYKVFSDQGYTLWICVTGKGNERQMSFRTDGQRYDNDQAQKPFTERCSVNENGAISTWINGSIVYLDGEQEKRMYVHRQLKLLPPTD